VLLGKPNVYGSIFQFEGQISVFNYRNEKGELGPNYRDLFPFPPPPGQVPGCSEAGVLGVLPGIIGSLQALEVIKIVTGIGKPLSGQLFIFDALSSKSSTFTFSRTEDNPVNGKNPSITSLIDYEEFCGLKAAPKAIKEISPSEFYKWQASGEPFQLIDVREPNEYEIVNLGGELIPLGTIIENAGNISKNKKVVLHCKMGGRSTNAIRELEEKFGFNNLYNLRGGILAYIDEIRPDLTRY
jgi:adenylyltransferase/sulfurtransferase